MSERDVVLTDFMREVRDLYSGTLTEELLPVPVVACEPLLHSQAVDRWFALRIRTEQVLAEANAMLGSAAHFLIEDDCNTGDLAFVIRRHQAWARLSVRPGDPAAAVVLDGSFASALPNTEPDGLAALEPLVLALLAASRHLD